MPIIDRAQQLQDEFDGRLKHVGHGRYGRILRMARKPTHDEYVRVLQITFIGAFIIGITGFAMYIFFSQVAPWFWSTYLAGL